MGRVNNRKIIAVLAKRSMLASKGKSAVAVLAIVLTTVLFTSFFTVSGSLVTRIQEETMRQVGESSHSSLSLLTQSEYDTLKNDKELKEISYRIYVGMLANEEVKSVYTEVSYYEEKEAEFCFCYPEAGHLPEEKDDVVLSDKVLNMLGLPCKLGEKIPLEITIGENVVKHDFTLSGYYKGDPIAMSYPVAVSKAFQEEYAPTPTESILSSGALSVDDMTGRIIANFNFDNSLFIKQKVKKLYERCEFPYSTDVGASMAYMGSNFDPMTVVLIAVIILVAFSSGYMIIYNIFYINVYSEVRHYGLLKTVGTTGKQLKKIVKIQADMLSLIGIPIGLVLGAVIGKVLVPVIMQAATFSESIDNKAALSPIIFIGAALFSWLTVRISCRKPCKMAAAVTPVEALRTTEGDTSKNKKKTVKKTAKVTPLSLAHSNIGKSRKRVAVVVLSVSLGMVFLNSISGLLNGFDIEKYVSNMAITDYTVTDYTVLNAGITQHVNLNSITDDFLKELEKQEGIESSSNVYALEYCPKFTNGDWNKIKERVLLSNTFKSDNAIRYMIESNGMSDKQFVEMLRDSQTFVAMAYGIGELVFNNLDVVNGELDWNKFKTGKYVITTNFINTTNDTQAEYFQPGETITIMNENGKGKDYTVMAVAEVPYAATPHHSTIYNLNYILPEKEFLGLYGKRQPMTTIFNVEDDKTEDIESWIDNYCKTVNNDLAYTSRVKIIDEFKGFINVFNVVGGVIVFILMIIGILNFTNTIFTSIITRRKELAMLEAVGMTVKQQKQMLIAEGGYYTVMSGIVSLVIGGLIDIFVIRTLGNSLLFFYSWHFTVMPIIICIPIMLVISSVVPLICFNQIQKSTVVERMRITD